MIAWQSSVRTGACGCVGARVDSGRGNSNPLRVTMASDLGGGAREHCHRCYLRRDTHSGIIAFYPDGHVQPIVEGTARSRCPQSPR